MVPPTQSKQEKVPVLFALGLVLALAVIALTLVAPSKSFTFRGVQVNGLAQSSQGLTTWGWTEADRDPSAPLGSISNPLPAQLANDPWGGSWDGPRIVIGEDMNDLLTPVNSPSLPSNTEDDDFFGSFFDFPSAFNGLEPAYRGVSTAFGAFFPSSGAYPEPPDLSDPASAVGDAINQGANSARNAAGGGGSGGTTEEDIAREIGAAYDAQLTGAPAPTNITLTGRSSNNVYMAGANGELQQVVLNANTGVNRAASAQPTSCVGTKCQFENPLGPKNNSLETFLNSILDVIILVGSIVVVISIILAGLKYVTAQGDEGKISDAHKQLTWTVIGAAILLGAKVIALVIQNTVKALT